VLLPSAHLALEILQHTHYIVPFCQAGIFGLFFDLARKKANSIDKLFIATAFLYLTDARMSLDTS